MSDVWISTPVLAGLAGISRRAALKAVINANNGEFWRGQLLRVRQHQGKGGKSGLRYEVLLSSLSEELQRAFRGDLETGNNLPVVVNATPPAKFIAARNQSEEESRRYRVLFLIMDTQKGTQARADAIRDASLHHDVPVRTIHRWLKRCEEHDWDLDCLGRQRPSDSGQQRVWVSRTFDRHFRQCGYDQEQLEQVADWFTREIAGWWQSPVQRAGWKRVRLEAVYSLQRYCTEQGVELPTAAYSISRRRVEELRYHSAVDIMAHDAKRHDNAKARIRRDNSRFLPMAQVVMDVKPLDCVLMRPDGTLAYPKLIGFQDTGTHRLYGRIVLLPQGEGVRQEHVTSAFLDMVDDDDWGLPQQLYCDNGSEYKHFELIREALKMVAHEGARVIVHAKPYSGASKPIESKFSVIDRHITSLMAGYTGSNRMDKKIQRMGKQAEPYAGSIDDFEAEFLMRLRDFQTVPIDSGPFKGRSPTQIYHDHLDNGWQPVRVHRLALDCAFSKQLGQRKIDRGAITINSQRYRHSELASFAGRRVQIVMPYRRDSWPLANLPDVGWVALEPEMMSFPDEIDGAREAGRMQRKHNQGVRRLKNKANAVDPLGNVRSRVEALPTRAAPAPLIEVMMSDEAERFAGARIEAARRRQEEQSAEQKLMARQMAETERLEKYLARNK